MAALACPRHATATRPPLDSKACPRTGRFGNGRRLGPYVRPSMSNLDGFVLGQAQPHFLPGETARCAAGASTFRSAAEIAAAKVAASGGLLGAAMGAAANVNECTPVYVVATTERLYVIATESRLEGRDQIYEPVNSRVGVNCRGAPTATRQQSSRDPRLS